MTPQEKAKELVEKYSGLVYPYMGSSMLTNDIYPEVILANSKTCALIAVEEILSVLGDTGVYSYADPKVEIYWCSVKQEIENL